MKLRKLMFVLPNLFTCTSIFCGFYALTLCAGDAQPAQLYQASIAVIFAMFFDGFDGRVARLTKTQSDFGVELDSLADVVSFGVVPAMLVYKWALGGLGFVGLFISFAFATCGALRLARFNVLAQRTKHGGASRYFVGLPIPVAAVMLVSAVIAHYVAQGPQARPLGPAARVPVAGLVLALALLMVSTVRYRTFKDVRLSKKSATAFALFCAVGVAIAVLLHPAFVPAAYLSLYLVVGLVESAVLLARKLATAGAAGAAAAPPVEREEEDELAEEEEESADSDVDEQDYL
ncbi:MAG TPA: CDP-diacylglycerol--serine O-phosphatidyltransferase [Myxococcales bacterium]|nr:CDP-diacylglycerol--serine O-phosphatidyltransferase [Myxococcales bacterium]